MATITSDKLLDFLRKRGLKELGSGAYSNVFAPVTSDRVIKVCRNSDRWLDYVLWATKKGYAGTFAPKVYSIHAANDWYVATMERLKMTIRQANDAKISYHYEQIDRATWKDEPIKPETEAAYPGIGAFINDLKSFGVINDMHQGNVMLRANGSICFTDPFQGQKEYTPTRMRARDIAWTRNSQFANQKAYAKA